MKCHYKMKCSVICILFTLSLCDANNLVCQLFNESKKSLEKYCEWFNSEYPKDCTSDFFDVESSHVTHLKIGGCNSSTVVEIVKNYQNIKSLDISYSGYESLEWLNLEFQHLNKFNASYNILTEIPQQLLKNARELIEIDLSHNKFATIQKEHFNEADQLKSVDFSNNFIGRINCDAFEGAINLEYIDLSGNRLNAIPIFSVNKMLKTIHLEDNKIREFNCSFLSSWSSTSVYLSWKNILKFSGDRGCNGKRIYVIPSSKHEGLLTASDGNFKLLCNEQSFSSLNHFVAGKNAFKNVADVLKCFSDVHSIDLSGNAIGVLNKTLFKKLYFLERLNLSNTMLTDFDASVLQSPARLKLLDLSQNHLKGIRSVSHLNYLKEFNVAGNWLQNTPEIVQNLGTFVKKLDLSDNFIGKLYAVMFKRLSAVEKLKLSNTSLSFPDSDPFERLIKLSSLDISHNNLTNANFSVLSNTLNKLEEFRAVDCHIQNVMHVIQHLRPLTKQLDLSENWVEQLNGKGFDKLINLDELTLSNTRISHFDSMTLQNLTKLSILNISKNLLKTIDFAPISKYLKVLNLEGNDLIEINHLKRANFMHLNAVAISNNQLPCEMLKRFTNDFQGIQFNGDPLTQKHGFNCRVSTATIIIGVLIATAILIMIGFLCVIFWKQIYQPFQTISLVH